MSEWVGFRSCEEDDESVGVTRLGVVMNVRRIRCGLDAVLIIKVVSLRVYSNLGLNRLVLKRVGRIY